jgi:hypothetical protein
MWPSVRFPPGSPMISTLAEASALKLQNSAPPTRDLNCRLPSGGSRGAGTSLSTTPLSASNGDPGRPEPCEGTIPAGIISVFLFAVGFALLAHLDPANQAIGVLLFVALVVLSGAPAFCACRNAPSCFMQSRRTVSCASTPRKAFERNGSSAIFRTSLPSTLQMATEFFRSRSRTTSPTATSIDGPSNSTV